VDADPVDILIRPARFEDATAIAELCAQPGYLSSPVQVKRRLEQIAYVPFHSLVVAETGGQISGWAYVQAYTLPEMDFHAELGGLVVAKEHRGAGVGKDLLAAGEEWACQKGFRELWVRSNVIRTEAHQFYQALGYEHINSQHTFRKRL